MIRRKALLRALKALPTLAVVAADVYLLCIGNAHGLPTGAQLFSNLRLTCFLVTILLAAIGVLVGRLALQLACTLLMAGLVVLGAASIGLFYAPALIASVFAIIVEMGSE